MIIMYGYLFKKEVIKNNEIMAEYLSYSAETLEDAIRQLRATLIQRYPKKKSFNNEFKQWSYVKNGTIF